MKRGRRGLDIFNMSFLDVISCGFGAVVLLILTAKPEPDINASSADATASQVRQLFAMRSQIETLEEEFAKLRGSNAKLANQQGLMLAQKEKMTTSIEELERQRQKALQTLSKLAKVQQTETPASIATTKKPEKRDPHVGGIPIDSEYVVFVVDTSGSMQNIWKRVTTQVGHLLDIHPKVKGFQILNDMGQPMLSGYDGKWMPDTDSFRRRALNHMNKWTPFSNSNPVEGVEKALKEYAPKSTTMSIYVFGDEYSGGDYDPVLNAIRRMNARPSTGAKGNRLLARIHGVGFLGVASPLTSMQFSTLMQEMTRQNNGTYIALPR